VPIPRYSFSTLVISSLQQAPVEGCLLFQLSFQYRIPQRILYCVTYPEAQIFFDPFRPPFLRVFAEHHGFSFSECAQFHPSYLVLVVYGIPLVLAASVIHKPYAWSLFPA